MAKSTTGTLTITGNVTGRSASGATGGSTISHSGSGTISITGAVTGGNGNATGAVALSSTGTLNITGTVTGGGDVFATAYGVYLTGAGTVTITGDVAGTATVPAVAVAAAATLTFNGNISGNSGATGYGVIVSAAGSLFVNGTITAGSGAAGVYCTVATAKLILNGNLVANATGYCAIGPGIVLVHASSALTHTYRVNNAGAPGVARSLYTGGQNLGQPSAADVRYGTTFGVSNEYTGQIRIPPAGSVAFGVLVDNTTGTATLSHPGVLQQTTIATLASQTSFTLTAGSADNDAYNGLTIVVTDASTSTQKCVGTISGYVGSTRTVTLSSDPGIFTMAVGDSVAIIATLSDNVISESKFADDTAKYQAKIWFLDDTSNDRYAVVWFKNGEPIVAGITSPTIWVYDTSGADLLGTSGSPQALTQIGATGTYMHDEGTNRVVDGTLYLARVRATIDGSTRTWYQQLGRDA